MMGATFLTIPFELKEKIFDHVLDGSATDLASTALTCRRLNLDVDASFLCSLVGCKRFVSSQQRCTCPHSKRCLRYSAKAKHAACNLNTGLATVFKAATVLSPPIERSQKAVNIVRWSRKKIPTSMTDVDSNTTPAFKCLGGLLASFIHHLDADATRAVFNYLTQEFNIKDAQNTFLASSSLDAKRARTYLTTFYHELLLTSSEECVNTRWLAIILEDLPGEEAVARILLLIHPDQYLCPSFEEREKMTFIKANNPNNFGLNLKEMSDALRRLLEHEPIAYPRSRLINFTCALINANLRFFEGLASLVESLGTELVGEVVTRLFTAADGLPLVRRQDYANSVGTHLSRSLPKLAFYDEKNVDWLKALLKDFKWFQLNVFFFDYQMKVNQNALKKRKERVPQKKRAKNAKLLVDESDADDEPQ